MDKLKCKILRQNAVLPKRATDGSAGCDLCACIDEPLLLKAGGRAAIPTGIAIAIEAPDIAAFIFGRSGLGIKHGITLSNGVGVIDPDYRGEIHVGLNNRSDEDYIINPGERIAQMILMPVKLPKLLECDELPETSRGEGGFGSTGR
ncbi:MAG: dUTP diphosphatase [Oscillospiraceae bacterium]|nr:dUTP diphosphatase [Oscillospiraceae bacterium]